MPSGLLLGLASSPSLGCRAGMWNRQVSRFTESSGFGVPGLFEGSVDFGNPGGDISTRGLRVVDFSILK